MSDLNNFNVFNTLECQEEEQEKITNKEEKKCTDNIFDNISLDSTGVSWADMDDDDDDYCPGPPQLAKPLFVSEETLVGFTKVLSRKDKNKSSSSHLDGYNINCRGCGYKFNFSNGKAIEYKSRGWEMPKLCRNCGRKKREGVLYKTGPRQKVDYNN